MKQKVLLISSASPYPVVTSGCERLVMEYQQTVFSNYDVHFIAMAPGTWTPLTWHHENAPPRQTGIETLLDLDFAFAFFVGFKWTDFTQRIADRFPSFCLTDTYPHPDVPDRVFKGILSHRMTAAGANVLLCGGSYNADIFHKYRQTEAFVLSVGRIHPDKNQLDLVRDYRRRIYDMYGLPLYLVGGVDDADYYHQVCPYIDGVAVRSTIDPDDVHSPGNWRSAPEIAELCNRARFYVTASPKESFGIALIEAMACGTTCITNGDYWGFDPADLGPHVFGSTTGRRGSVLDWLDAAFTQDIRLDGSEWAKKYATQLVGVRQLDFIERRLGAP